MKNIKIVLSAIGLLLLVIWISYVFVMIHIFPDWTTRGQFGDMFGSINTLFSCFAFIGLIYTIILQKTEMNSNMEFMEAQLKEMRNDRSLQFQPMPIINIMNLTAEKPRLFYSPPENKCRYFSRYFMNYTIFNDSDNVALNVIIKAKIAYKSNDTEVLGPAIEAIDMLKTKYETNNLSAMFVQDKSNSMLSTIREANIFSMPCLVVEIAYKNIMGSCFRIERGYHVDVSGEDDDEIIKKWLMSINSFKIEYKKEIETIEDEKTNNSVETSTLYDSIKEKCDARIIEDEIVLQCTEIPGTFILEHITEDEYSEFLSGSSFGVKLPVLNNKCLSEH